MKKLTSTALFALAIVSAAAPAFADTPGVSFANGIGYDGDGPWTLGYEFTANTAATVTALGVFDLGGDGLGTTHTVGLWDAAGTLLTSVTVDSSGTLIDGFRYADISSITLTSGANYYVAASDLGRGDGYWLDASVTSDPSITYDTGVYSSGSGLNFPASDGGSGGYFGGNILLSAAAVPEPASWAMMVGGFGLMGAVMRRKRASVTFA